MRIKVFCSCLETPFCKSFQARQLSLGIAEVTALCKHVPDHPKKRVGRNKYCYSQPDCFSPVVFVFHTYAGQSCQPKNEENKYKECDTECACEPEIVVEGF